MKEAHRQVLLRNLELEKERAKEERELEERKGWDEDMRKLYDRIKGINSSSVNIGAPSAATASTRSTLPTING